MENAGGRKSWEPLVSRFFNLHVLRRRMCTLAIKYYNTHQQQYRVLQVGKYADSMAIFNAVHTLSRMQWWRAVASSLLFDFASNITWLKYSLLLSSIMRAAELCSVSCGVLSTKFTITGMLMVTTLSWLAGGKDPIQLSSTQSREMNVPWL